jgi:signal transduction histidine kinase
VNLDELIDRITGRWSASWKGWLYLSVVGILGTASRLTTLHGLTYFKSFAISITIAIINTPVFYLITITLLKDRKIKNVPLPNVFAYYIILWLTDSSSEIAITHYVLDKTAYLGPQLFATLFPDIFGFAAISYLLAEFDANRKDIGRLIFAQKELLKVTKETQEKVFAERSNLIQAIQDRIFFQLDSLKQQVNSLTEVNDRREIEKLANKLEQFSLNSIRLLSHEMVEDSENQEKINRSSFVGSQAIRNFTNFYAPFISARISLLVMVVVGGFNQLSLNGFSGLEYQVLSSLAIFPILLLASILTRRISPKNPKKGFVLFLLAIFATGYFGVVSSRFILENLITLRNSYSPTVFASRALVTVIFASLIVTIVEARRKTLRDLVSMNSKLEKDIEAFDGRSSELRRDISLILHGPLQGRIAGIALALRMSSKDSTLSENERVKKLKEIQVLLESVISEVRERFNVDSESSSESVIVKLIEIRRSWSGIAEINWSVEPKSYARIEKLNSKTLRDVLYEAVSNSVRHGEADQINIVFQPEKNGLLIKIQDNGRGLGSDYTASVGLKSITIAGGEYFFTDNFENGAELNIVFKS